MLKSLQIKDAVVLDHYRRTSGRSAGVYRAVITPEEYVALQMVYVGVEINIGYLINSYKSKKAAKPDEADNTTVER